MIQLNLVWARGILLDEFTIKYLVEKYNQAPRTNQEITGSILEELKRREAEAVRLLMEESTRIFFRGVNMTLYAAVFETEGNQEVLGIYNEARESGEVVENDKKKYPLRDIFGEYKVIPFEIGQELPFEES